MDIVKLLSQFATPAILSQIAQLLGISQASAAKAFGAAAPSVLAGLAGLASKPQGAASLASALQGLGAGGMEDVARQIGRDPGAAASAGSDLLSSLLGGGTVNTLAGKLQDYAGLPAGGAGKILGLAGSAALAGLRSEAGSQGLDAAGLARILEGQKAAIAGAVPRDFASALKGTGVLGELGDRVAAATAAAPRPVPPVVPPVVPPKRPGWTRWLIVLAAAVLLAWLLPRFFRQEPAPVAPEPPPVVQTTPEPAPAEPAPAAEATPDPAPAEPAPAAQATPEPAPADPLVVGGVDLGATVTGALESLTATLAGVTDAASAEAALPRLTEARDALAGVEGTVSALPEAGRSALREMVAGALPAIRSTIDGLLANSTVGPVIQPIVTDILARLDAFAA